MGAIYAANDWRTELHREATIKGKQTQAPPAKQIHNRRMVNLST
ncbi:hypothetical protein [Bradyrhizobium australiense]|nr:hypothetical protein [Bradyrhizobium australiense]